MAIKFLSDTTINRIAAGEVIERPASVVKELVENAIDAGADNIDIILEGSGKNLIIVSDNGSGMSEHDLSIAILRHTTSKLDESDLLNINSFGFRGEALPSIGAISRMSIISKHKDEHNAYKIELIGGIVTPPTLASHNIGTKFEIRDLFFATPARLKFLRTDKTELAACVDVVKKIALSHPAISFSIANDGRNLFKSRKIEQPTDYTRIQDILGAEFIANSAIVRFALDGLNISGHAAVPTYNKASAEEQFLFVNNRPVKDKLLNIALRIAYQDYLARDRFPAAVLFLNINPNLVDVNVHPAKTEVRFYDPNFIRNSLISAIKTALSIEGNKVSYTISSEAIGSFIPQTQNLVNRPYGFIQPISKQDINEGFKHYTAKEPDSSYKAHNLNELYFKQTPISSSQALIPTLPFTKATEANQSVASEEFPLGAAKAQVVNTYIISQTRDSIILTDQHAAHERLGYEKIKNLIASQGLIKQRLLMPEVVEFSDEYKADLLHEYKTQLSDLGLSIEKFGRNSIIVTEIPSLLGDININNLIKDLSDQLHSFGEHIALSELIEHVTETYACHYSIRAGRSLNIDEMNEVLRQMENTPFSAQCNHGRPTYIELKLKDIEKLFGRS